MTKLFIKQNIFLTPSFYRKTIQLPMQKMYIQNNAPKGKELKESPKNSVVNFLLAYSRSLEVKKSKQINTLYLQMN
jgi:hypothetical protein